MFGTTEEEISEEKRRSAKHLRLRPPSYYRRQTLYLFRSAYRESWARSRHLSKVVVTKLSVIIFNDGRKARGFEGA
jgi:hypothetical protein